MYASVRKFEVPPDRVEEFMHRVDADFAPELERMPGFVAYQVIDGGLDRSREARIFAITVCHDRASAERSAELAAQFVDEELADLGVEGLEATTGAVRVSRAVSEMLGPARA
jgi:Antibiotic biosynthesis monooxygenase